MHFVSGARKHRAVESADRTNTNNRNFFHDFNLTTEAPKYRENKMKFKRKQTVCFADSLCFRAFVVKI
jgi:hypothetical protein